MGIGPSTNPRVNLLLLHRTCAVPPPVTRWAWPTWAPCVTPSAAAPSLRTMGCPQLSPQPTSWVRHAWGLCMGWGPLGPRTLGGCSASQTLHFYGNHIFCLSAVLAMEVLPCLMSSLSPSLILQPCSVIRSSSKVQNSPSSAYGRPDNDRHPEWGNSTSAEGRKGLRK